MPPIRQKEKKLKAEIDFGDIGLKIGDEIVLDKTGARFMVASGSGEAGNGGTLVSSADHAGELFTLETAARRALGGSLSPEIDLFSLFSRDGQTLRSLYEKKAHKE